MDGGAWRAIVHGVAKSQTQLSNFTFTSLSKILCLCRAIIQASQVTLPAVQEIQVRSLGQKGPLEKVMATHCNSLALRIPWTRSMQATDHGSKESNTTQWLTHTHTHTHTTFITTIPEHCQSFHSSYVSFYYCFHELSNFHIVFFYLF